MEFILKNGIVYDPANGINGEKKDIMVEDDIIVEEVSADAKVIDVTNKIVMPAGVDPHAHVAGPKLVVVDYTDLKIQEGELLKKQKLQGRNLVFPFQVVHQLVTDTPD